MVNVVKHTNTKLNYKAIDIEPEFPGGTKALYRYISKNINYEGNSSTDASLQGLITLSMTIEKDGRVTDVKIIKGLSEDIDKATLRVIASSPNWKPGIQHGKPIRVRYTFSFNYALKG